MATNKTTIRVNARLADEAKKLLGVKSRAQAVHIAVTDLVALSRSKTLMKKNIGQISFITGGK